MNKQIKVGDTIIVNHFDCPCSRLVAVVVAVADRRDNPMVKWQYLCDEKRLASFDDQWTPVQVATPTRDFGVELRAKDGVYWLEQTAPSIATYGNGEPRQWQDPYEFLVYRYRNHLFELMQAKEGAENR